MNVREFIAKWERSKLTESSASQQHFLDLCEVVGHPKPAAVDPTGESFTFEKGASKHGGGDGWADVWKRGFFGWEYKGKHKDLGAAYDQLLKYREALENPPLLVVSDMDRIVVHTNFTGTRTEVHDIPLAELDTPRGLEVLHAVFDAPEKLRPGATSQAITTEAASVVGELAIGLRDRGLEPRRVARFLDRMVFAFFAEDVGLLSGGLVTKLLDTIRADPKSFSQRMGQLFSAMADGGYFGVDTIRRFNGDLFDTGEVLDLTRKEIEALYRAARLDWGAVDPSIFGTLFERGMDPDKRSQLGAHYTSREDIEALVEPVVMTPLRRQWTEAQQLVDNLLATGKKHPKGNEKPPIGRALAKSKDEGIRQVRRFLENLAHVTVLDPACGSGNFLYVTLQKLKDLEKAAIVYAQDRLGASFIPLVGPWQLYGIEMNLYAHELAQMTVWIGYLQWVRNNGFGVTEDPVLRPMDNFQCKDAILDRSNPEQPREPEWPEADFVVGNPPFLGGKRLRSALGDDYVDRLFRVWGGRVPAEADLVTYWFEKARTQIETGKAKRAGLLATQGIRGGANREVLKKIKETGGIFFAVSDRNWVLDGAMVHVSMIGFDSGREKERELDGISVAEIYSNLTATVDVTTAQVLPSRRNISYMGDSKGGNFEISEELALEMLQAPNPQGRSNSDVVVPWTGGVDLNGRDRGLFIIDFGVRMSDEEAAKYELPFQHVKKLVWPKRQSNRRAAYRERWWLHVEPRPSMRASLRPLGRFLATTRHGPHRCFRWLRAPTLPDSALIVFADQSFEFFGTLQSRIHEVWARTQGSQVRDRASGFRYTPTSCFETFAFPKPTKEQKEEIAHTARELDELRERWLNPPEWVREEVLEFAGSSDGPWAGYVQDADQRGTGTVRYPHLVARDEECSEKLKRRTLTELYNLRPAWLEAAHGKLDEAVFAAYGWSPDLADDEVLEHLLALNLQRPGEGEQN